VTKKELRQRLLKAKIGKASISKHALNELFQCRFSIMFPLTGCFYVKKKKEGN
jgi:hypothetical protein